MIIEDAKKKRTRELQLAATRILAASGADVSQGVAVKPLAKAMAKQSGCDYRTARRHIEMAIRQAQHMKS